MMRVMGFAGFDTTKVRSVVLHPPVDMFKGQKLFRAADSKS